MENKAFILLSGLAILALFLMVILGFFEAIGYASVSHKALDEACNMIFDDHSLIFVDKFMSQDSIICRYPDGGIINNTKVVWYSTRVRKYGN